MHACMYVMNERHTCKPKDCSFKNNDLSPVQKKRFLLWKAKDSQHKSIVSITCSSHKAIMCGLPLWLLACGEVQLNIYNSWMWVYYPELSVCPQNSWHMPLLALNHNHPPLPLCEFSWNPLTPRVSLATLKNAPSPGWIPKPSSLCHKHSVGIPSSRICLNVGNKPGLITNSAAPRKPAHIGLEVRMFWH